MAQRGGRAGALHLLRRLQGALWLEHRMQVVGDRLEGRVSGTEAGLHLRLDELERRHSQLQELVEGDLRHILRAIASEDAENRRRLWRARAAPEYELPFTEDEPLVSVVIPTVDRVELLCERALPSVLGQTYERLEVLVVGNAAEPKVADVVRGMGDERVTFCNLTQRRAPDPDPIREWHKNDVMPRNEGFRRAQGQWLVSFDDDDAMRPQHVELLLAAAREHRAEVAYGRLRMVLREGERIHGRFPPELNEFGWQAAIRHAGLGFFERELFAPDFGMPSDFFMVEAMLRAGVRFTMIPEVVFDYFPARERRDD